MHPMQIIRARVIPLLALGALACAGDKPKEQLPAVTAVKVPLFTYSTKSEDARKHVQEGERLEDMGYPTQANDEFRRAVAADSSFGYAYIRTAQWFVSVDDYTSNVKRAEARLASANPVERLIIQAESRLNENDTKGAVALLKQVTELEPKNARGWMLLGRQYSNVNDGAGARAALAQAIALDSTYALPMFLMAGTDAFLEPRDLARAETYTLAGMKQWPATPTSLIFLGQLRRAQGRSEDAIAAYTRYIALDPTEGNAYLLRGNANVFAGHFEAARSDYDESIRLSKPVVKGTAALSRTEVDAFAGNIDATLKAQSELVGALDGMHLPSPRQDRANVRFTQAVIAIANGRYAIADTSAKDYEVSQMAEAANSPGALHFFVGQVDFLKGTLAAARGDIKVAQAEVDDLERVRRADNGPDKDHQLLGLRGFIALQEKHYAAADSLLKAADPGNALMTFVYWRALAMEALGRMADEKALLQFIASYNFVSQENAAVHADAIAKLKTLP